MSFRFVRLLPFAVLALLATPFGTMPTSGAAADVSAEMLGGLKWRNIGPFHGGRIAAVTGAIGQGQSGVFYVGTPAGGIWKTTSAGVTWFPVFDQFTNVDSIGAIQVAPSDPNIIYAGTGDSVQGPSGDGMYKSTDAGKTWTHIGLEDTTKINKICVDPKDPNLVIASTQGDARHTGQGIYRTTDGGKTWENTLKPANANGTRDVEYAYDVPNVIFATSQAGGGFGGGGAAPAGGGAAGAAPAQPAGGGTALYKSTDSGKTWKQIDNLPPYTGRISVAVAMHTNAQRLYVVGGALQGGSGLYRSDDQGATWQHMGGTDTRIGNGQGAYSSGVWVDSQNPDVVYTVSTTVYKSSDGGKTFSAFKGAPGGEDPHDIWIDPTNGQRMLFGMDQGPGVTLDGGKTWSGYYQISISQVYHVTTDTRYPYWVLASQQDTGAIMSRSRSDQGQITIIDWMPLPSSEFGTVEPDPLHPNIVYGVGYGNGQGAGLIKIDLNTGQWGNVSPSFGADSALYSAGRDFWKRFDKTFEPKALYVGYNCILVTRDGAQTWKAFSPDLTAPKGQKLQPCGVRPAATATAAPATGRAGAPVPATVTTTAANAPPAGRGRGRATTTPPAGAAGATPTPAPAPAPQGGGRGGNISDFSLSTIKKGVVWSGSSNGQIYNTFDGGLTWTNVTNFTDLPPNATPNFVTVEASHTDINTAYVVANVGGGRGATGPEQHYVYRTHDAGKTWTRIVNGLPGDERTGSQVHVLREDPKQKGLLFIGTETTVFVSFDDGDHWQSLRLNLPSTSIRDMVFHTDDHMNDLVIGTYGRGFWVLDDMSPLRDIAARSAEIGAAPAYLFKPGDAIRARMNSNWDQPLNPELAHWPNPPYGALLYYHLSKPPAGEVQIQISDAAGKHVRTLSSNVPPAVERPPYPDYWLMAPQDRALSTAVGTNRINWDLRYDDPPGYNPDINNQMSSSPGTVTPAPHGPLALPGTYTVKLVVNGVAANTQTLVVHNDPRIGESPAVMSALKAQNKLVLAAYQAMKDSAAGNDEVTAVRAQVAALASAALPADLATAVTALDAKLATFGGAGGRGGRGGGAPPGGGRGGGAGAGAAAVTSFTALNGSFNLLVELNHNGIDMAPTRAQVDTWEADCKNFNATVVAWKSMLGVDLVSFNDQLTKAGKTPIKTTPSTIMAVPSCTFAAPAAAPAAGAAGRGGKH